MFKPTEPSSIKSVLHFMLPTTISLLSGGRMKEIRLSGGSVKVNRIEILLCKNVKWHTNLKACTEQLCGIFGG